MLFRKFIHNLIFKHKPSGWIEDEEDERDYKYEDYFEEEIFGAVIPDIFRWKDNEIPKISYQGNTLSCVCNAFSFLNAFNSKKEKNDVFLSWRYLYAKVERLKSGTTFRDNAKILKQYGQCLDLQMPQSKYWLAKDQKTEKNRITLKIENIAKKYRIKGYFYINSRRKEELKTALLNSPIIIGIYTNNKIWDQDVIKWNGDKHFGHSVVLIGWTKKYWFIADWVGDKRIKKLDINYPIISAIQIRDLPDEDYKIMLKTVKIENNNKIYLLLKNGEKQHINSFEQYQEGLRKKIFKDFVLIKQEELDTYKNAKHPLIFQL